MRPDKTITLNPAQLKEAINSLQGRGIIELSISKQETAPNQKPIFIRSGSVFQQLRAWLSSKSTRATKAEQVCSHLQSALRNMPGQEQLLKNVRDQIMEEGRLTGEFLALNLKALKEGRVLVPKADKPFLLPVNGQQVRILSGVPTEIASERCVVGYDTAEELLTATESMRGDLQQLAKLQSWSVGDHANGGSPILEFSSTVSRAKTIASCPPLDKSSTKDRTPREMFDLIQNAIGKATGRIVIEPQPDRFELGEPAFSDTGLQAQILAALQTKSHAQKSDQDRVIAFVSPDLELLKRIESLHAQMMREWKSASSSDAR